MLDILSFADEDWVGDIDKRISTSGYAFNLFGREMSCMRKRKYVVALSITMNKYITNTHAIKEVVWL